MKQPRSITSKKAGKKFQCFYHKATLSYGIRLVDNNSCIAMLLRDKKALQAHLEAGGTAENWTPAYAMLQPKEIDEYNILKWNTVLELDWKDEGVVAEMEKNGHIVRGLTVQEYFKQAVDNYLNLLTTVQS